MEIDAVKFINAIASVAKSDDGQVIIEALRHKLDLIAHEAMAQPDEKAFHEARGRYAQVEELLLMFEYPQHYLQKLKDTKETTGSAQIPELGLGEVSSRQTPRSIPGLSQEPIDFL
jgi:hypothetical protein